MFNKKNIPNKIVKISSVMLLSMSLCLSACSSKAKHKRMMSNQSQSNTHGSDFQKDIMKSEEMMNNVLFFAFDSDILPDSVSSILSPQIKVLSSKENFKVMIQGHCDRIGTREYNIALGERRAEKVKRYFIACGISPDRIFTTSFGKEKLFSFGTTPEDDAKNRRAVIIISEE